MSKSQFSLAIAAKKSELKISTAALAKTIGVGAQALADVMAGRRVPNAATLAKYATFLGLDLEQVKALVGKADAPAKKGRKAKAGKSAKSEKSPKAAKAVQAPKVAKPAKAAKAPKRAKEVDLASVSLGDLVGVFADDLAVAVHQASDDKRKVIAMILDA